METTAPLTIEKSLIYVVEDDQDVARLVTRTLNAVGYDVRSFATAEEFLDQGTIVPCSVAIVDILLPGMTGLKLCRELTLRQWPCTFALITGYGDVSMAVEAMRLGAVDVLEKPFGRERLLDVVHDALRASRIKHSRQTRKEDAARRLAKLSSRERSVFTAMADGLVTKEIAARLGVSSRTVDVHRSRIMHKLEIRSPSQLANLLAIVDGEGGGDAVEGRAPAESRACEERYRALLEACPDAIGLLDFSGRILDANHRGARMHGYSRDELLALNVRDLAVPEDTGVEERLKRLQTGEPMRFETVHRRRDGKRLTLSVVASRARLQCESYVIAFCRDVVDDPKYGDLLGRDPGTRFPPETGLRA